MKRMIRISVALIALTLGSTQVSQAAFPIKKEVQPIATEQKALPAAEVIAASAEATPAMLESVKETKKQNFISRTINKVKKGDTIPQGLYIVMAIFFLGWLAMGINDDWSGYDWLISLVLYIILWLPGFIFSLIKMGKYY